MSFCSSIYSFGDKYDETYFGFYGDSDFYTKKSMGKEKVLYLGVGTGRIFSKIYNRNKKIIGLDVSKKMLGMLREKFPQIKAENLVVADIRNYKFKENYFEIIIAPYAFFNFFSYDDNLILLKKMKKSLKKNGVLITDYLSPFLNPPFNKTKEIIKNGSAKTTIEYDFLNQEFTEFNTYKNKNYRTKLHNFYFYPQEIHRIFTEAGFDSVEIFGGYKYNKLSTKSKLVLVEARKL